MSRLLSVSVSDELLARTEALALARATTKSELVREALRNYIWQERWRDVTGRGERRAAELGIGPEDVEGLVDEVRGAARSGDG